MVILITGGSSGIGKAIGTYLFQKGHKVYGTARNPKNYINTTTFPLIALDLTNEQTIISAIEQVISNEGHIDVLINNAGVGITGAVEELSSEQITSHFQTNYFGALAVIRAVLPSMRSRKSGLIINVTSIAASMGLPFRGVYSASKAALKITTEALRMELKEFGVKVCNVAPGDYVTDIASRRYHEPLKENSAYYTNYQKTLTSINEHVDLGSDPKEVALLIDKIIGLKNPKPNYAVGAFMQKFSLTLKRLLPQKWFEKLLLNHYDL